MNNRRHSREPKPALAPVAEESAGFEPRPFTAQDRQAAPDIQPHAAPAGNAGHDFNHVQSPTTSLRIQAKLMVGAAGDRYEQEADQVSAQVLQMPAPISDHSDASAPVNVQRAGGGSGFEAGPDIERGVSSQRGQGAGLAAQTRAFMEPRFGADFSSVRIHSDSQADTLNRSISARAFTTGNDIFFRRGEYQPGSADGQRLLAHELTHVVQQNGSGARVQRAFVTDVATDAKLFNVEAGSDTQPDLSAHTAEKKGALAITKVNMQHFLERHTYKHQQLSAKYRRYDTVLWPVGTTVTEVLDGLKTVLKLMEGRTNKNKMVNQIHTITMGGKSCNVQVGMISSGVLEQFFPVSGAGTQPYTIAELAQIEAEKNKPVVAQTPVAQTPVVAEKEVAKT
jgi:hypothetical protein